MATYGFNQSHIADTSVVAIRFLTDNATHPSTGVVLEDSSDTFWGISDRDFPILIGAAAGALGLVCLILGAIVIWFCCQLTLKQSKSVYSLDNESERGSVSSQGSHLYNNGESVIFVGVKPFDDESNNNANIKRSVSAPLNNGSQAAFEANAKPFVQKVPISREMKPFTGSMQYAYTNMTPDVDMDNSNDISSDNVKILSTSRSHLYTPSERPDVEILKTRSLPWKQSKRLSAEAEDAENFANGSGKVNFTKKRKNRMRNDSAAAIALNRSGESPAQMPFLHKDTDSLVDNEAVVVYDERTAL